MRNKSMNGGTKVASCSILQSPRQLGVIAIGLALVLLSGSTSQAQNGQLPDGISIFKFAKKDEVAKVWAIDRESGRLFASLHNIQRVIELNTTSGKEVRRMVMPSDPSALIVKSGHLVASFPDKRKVMVISLATNRPIATLDLDYEVKELGTTDDDSKFVYLFAHEGSGCRVAQLDVTKGEVAKSALTEGISLGDEAMIRSPPGGGPVYATVLQDRSWRTYRLDSNSLKLEWAFDPVADMYSVSDAMEFAPSGRWWTYAGSLYNVPTEPVERGFVGSPDDYKPVREYEGQFHSFHSRYDLAIGFTFSTNRSSGPVLDLQSFSDATKFKQIPFPSDFFTFRGTGRFPLTTNESFTLSTHAGQVVITAPQTIAVANLKELGVPLRSILLLKQPESASGMIEKEIALQLETFSSANGQSVTYSKVDGPAGLKVSDNGQVTWTPKVADVGKHSFTVKATAGDSSDQIEVPLQITRPQFTIDGKIVQMAVDREGTHVLAGCVVEKETERDPYRDPYFNGIPGMEQGAFDKLVLVDLNTMSVVAERKLEEPAISLCLSTEAAFVGHSDGGKVYRLKLSDLSEDKRVFIGTAPVSIDQFDDDNLFVATSEGGTGLKCADLTTVELPGRKSLSMRDFERFYGRQDRTSVFQRFGDDIAMRGVVLGPDGDIRMYDETVFSQEIPVIRGQGNEYNPVPDLIAQIGGQRAKSPAGTPQPWDRMVDYEGLYDVMGRRMASWAGPSQLLLKRPLAAVVTQTDVDGEPQERDPYQHFGDRSDKECLVNLELRELIEGREVKKFGLAVVNESDLGNAIGRQQLLIGEAGERVLVAFDNMIFAVDLDDVPARDANEPLWFEKYVAPPHTEVGRVVKIPLETHGGTGKVSYKLATSTDGVSINASSGVVSVDTQKLWNTWINDEENNWRYRRHFDDDEGFQTAQKEFADVFGESTTDIPLRIPFSVIATDQQGQTTTLSNQLVMLAPKTEWDAKMANLEAEAEKERERMTAEREKAAAERKRREAANNAAAGNSSVDSTAIAEVIRTSLAEMDAISSRLDDIEDGMRQLAEQQQKPAQPATIELDEETQQRLRNLDDQLAKLSESLEAIQEEREAEKIAVAEKAAEAEKVTEAALPIFDQVPQQTNASTGLPAWAWMLIAVLFTLTVSAVVGLILIRQRPPAG